MAWHGGVLFVFQHVHCCQFKVGLVNSSELVLPGVVGRRPLTSTLFEGVGSELSSPGGPTVATLTGYMGRLWCGKRSGKILSLPCVAQRHAIRDPGVAGRFNGPLPELTG